MFNVNNITDLQQETVALWHEQDIENTYEGFFELVCEQHTQNYLLWHQEDIARSREVTDHQIAQVKRNIDGYNQNRNDWIERLDVYLQQQIEDRNIAAEADAPLNTETPGSAIDRLSIMSLRIYHMKEQLERVDADEEHLEKVREKLAICYQQHDDLSQSLQQLLTDIFSGTKRLKLYRQMKMYNDPTLNAFLIKEQTLRKAG